MAAVAVLVVLAAAVVAAAVVVATVAVVLVTVVGTADTTLDLSHTFPRDCCSSWKKLSKSPMAISVPEDEIFCKLAELIDEPIPTAKILLSVPSILVFWVWARDRAEVLPALFPGPEPTVLGLPSVMKIT